MKDRPDVSSTTGILIDQAGNRVATIGDAVDAFNRIDEIDAMFEAATGWGSWMVSAANERERLINWLRAEGVTEAVEHRYLARTSDGGRTD